MQFGLQKYLSEIDSTRESLAYRDETDAHKYMEKMLSDADKMNGQVLVAEALEYRHHGIGKELMQKMIDYFKIQKCTSVRLLVLSDNKNAIYAYQKNGFIGHDLEMVLKI